MEEALKGKNNPDLQTTGMDSHFWDHNQCKAVQQRHGSDVVTRVWGGWQVPELGTVHLHK